MNKYLKWALALTLPTLLTLGSCRRHGVTDNCPCPTNNSVVRIQVVNLWGTDTIKYTKDFITQAGDTVRITDLKYLLSDFKFKQADGSYWEPWSPMYVKASDTSTHGMYITNAPDGNLSEVTFLLGLNDSTNHFDVSKFPSTSPLSFRNAGGDMHWNWADGYIFSVITGAYKPSGPSPRRSFGYHYGMDANRITYKISTPGLIINDNLKKLYINVDWKEMFQSPNTIRIADQEVTHSMSGDSLVVKLKANMADMFSFSKVE